MTDCRKKEVQKYTERDAGWDLYTSTLIGSTLVIADIATVPVAPPPLVLAQVSIVAPGKTFTGLLLAVGPAAADKIHRLGHGLLLREIHDNIVGPGKNAPGKSQ
jgi:hypothetical protein